MLRALAVVVVLLALAPAGVVEASRVKPGPPRIGLRARLKRVFLGRRAARQHAPASDPRGTARADHDRWLGLALQREPTRTRSPFEWRLANFRPRTRPGGGTSVKGVGARVLWVEADVALIRTDPGPDIFLPTRQLDAAARAKVVAGRKVVVDVVHHPTGGVVADNPRFDD